MKRRKIVQVAAVYAVVAWVLVQIVATVEAPLNLPNWVDTLVILLLLIGFPITMIMSWAYNVTPEGLVRDEGAGESTGSGGFRIEYVFSGFLALAVAILLYREFTPAPEVVTESPEPVPEEIVQETVREVLPNSVAVLPFRNDSPDPDNAYYASGIHEEILNHLVKLSALSVIARTSVEQYVDTEKSIPEIAEELNVETVMEGSVRYAGGRIRITTQLNDGVTGAHIWSETYTRDFDDIFAIESDVAMNVANALEAEFSLEEQEAIEKIPTNSPAAYALYLQAREEDRRRDPSIMHALLDRAIALDPDFALAYASKAWRYAVSLLDGAIPIDERATLEQLALVNLEQALMLDPGVGYAHMVQARIDMYHWRWADAIDAFERAVQLEPNNPTVLNFYSGFNSYLGRHEKAVELARRAEVIDPNNQGNPLRLATVYWYVGNYEAAAESLREYIRSGSTNPLAYLWLGYMESALGNNAEALRQLQIAEQISGEDIPLNWLPELAYAYAQLGRDEDASRLFSELEDVAGERTIGAGTWVLSYLAIGDSDKAFEWLNAAVEKVERGEIDEGFWTLMTIKANVYSDPVLEEPRFVELRNKLGVLD